MKGQDFSSLINMASKSKPQLPFLFVAGNLGRITEFNIQTDFFRKGMNKKFKNTKGKKIPYGNQGKMGRTTKKHNKLEHLTDLLKQDLLDNECATENFFLDPKKKIQDTKALTIDEKEISKQALKKITKAKNYLIDGQPYEGELTDGLCTGKGKLNCKDGSTYEGEFVDEQFHGQGIYKKYNGVIVEGRFAFGQMTDDVDFTYPKGVYHEGFYDEQADLSKDFQTIPQNKHNPDNLKKEKQEQDNIENDKEYPENIIE